MENTINYKQKIEQGIPLIKEWLERKRQDFEAKEEYKELLRVITEIQQDKDWSKDAYEDIRYILRPFQESISLQIKRIFNVSTLDNYCAFIASRHFETIDDFINLELSTKHFQGNLTKFFYNPIPLTNRTRPLFTHLRSLFIYSRNDNLFENDSRIIAREIQMVPYYLTYKQMKQLEQWTGLKCGGIVFDSEVNNWLKDTSIFDERIIGKKQLVFMIEDEDGELFGYYLNTEVVEKYYNWIETDSQSFEFNLQSKNNRLIHPMKFEIKDLKEGGYDLFEKSDDYLIILGDIYLKKENWKNESECYQNEDRFDYHGIRNALCGKTNPKTFTPKRILVIQMK